MPFHRSYRSADEDVRSEQRGVDRGGSRPTTSIVGLFAKYRDPEQFSTSSMYPPLGEHMSSVLTQDKKDSLAKSIEVAVREPLKDAFKEAMEEAEQERSSAARGRRLVRMLMLVGSGVAIGYRMRSEESMSEAMLAEETEKIEQREKSDDDEQSGGSTLRKLLLAGIGVGAVYALKSRMGSVDKVVDKATEQAQTVAEQTSERTDEAAERISTVTGEASDRVEQTGDQAAEQIGEKGDEAAQQVEQAAEKAEESDSSDEDEESEE